MALETSSSSRGQPCAAVSSQTMASSTRPAPAAAVGLGDVDAEVAVLTECLPQFAGELAGLGFAGVVVVAELGGDRGDRLPQREVLVGGGEVHQASWGCRRDSPPGLDASACAGGPAVPVAWCRLVTMRSRACS